MCNKDKNGLTVEDLEEVCNVHLDGDVGGAVGRVALANGAAAVLEVDEILARLYFRTKKQYFRYYSVLCSVSNPSTALTFST